jgi:hypothetical protein
MKSAAVAGILLVAGVVGCSPTGPADPPEVVPAHTVDARETLDATEIADAAAMVADPRLIVVHKNESCGCCHLWIEHLKERGFAVAVRDVVDLGGIKERVGVPHGMGSCHTARVGGYFIEGHVPAADIVRLLNERPDAKGLAVPGMPLGSPGMEVASGESQPYDVHLVARDGSTSVFAHHANEPAVASDAGEPAP